MVFNFVVHYIELFGDFLGHLLSLTLQSRRRVKDTMIGFFCGGGGGGASFSFTFITVLSY